MNDNVTDLDIRRRITEVAGKLGIPKTRLKKMLADHSHELPDLERRLNRRYKSICNQAEKEAEAQWHDEQAESSREKHQIVRRITRADRERQRSKQPLSKRLADLEEREALASTLSTPDFVSSQGRKPESTPPPRVTPFTDIRQHLEVVETIIQGAERLVDAELGYAKHPSALNDDEYNQEILRHEGRSAALVALANPHLGSVRTIERARVRLKRQPGNGLPFNDEEQKAA